MKEKVIIVGGGIAGLTAAHELIERDFEVHVYERRDFFGGKAASTRSAAQLPCEHGFRFYPAWYRHLPDTMGRIPYQGRRSYREAKTVLDNLVPVENELLVWYGREPIKLLTRVPRTLDQAKTFGSFVSELGKLGLAPGELAFFAQRMLQFLMTPDAQRVELWERVTWWEYLEADGKSPAYRDLIAATTRLMVAAKAAEASAYTIGRLALRTFSDALASVDCVLMGPTSELWITPWVDHLQGLGVQFHTGLELDCVAFEEAGSTHGLARQPTLDLNRLAAVEFSRVVIQQVRRLRKLLPSVVWAVNGLLEWDPGQSDGYAVQRKKLLESELERHCVAGRALIDAIRDDAGWQQLELPSEDEDDRGEVEAVKRLLPLLDTALASLTPLLSQRSGAVPHPPATAPAFEQALAGLLCVSAPALVASEDLSQAVARGLEAAADTLLALESTRFGKKQRAAADHFVFALPLEQMAYYVNRSTALTQHDPSLRRLILLSEYMSWMAGIQFYLKEPFRLVAGHIVCMDSSWSLTAIEETQFWRETDLEVNIDGVATEIKAVLSVDVAAWDRKGRFVTKEAFNCTADEIATEVWSQLKAAIGRQATTQRLRDDMLLGRSVSGRPPALTRGVNYHLDDSIADVYDQKKQAAYENARSVAFSADELIARQERSGVASQLPHVWGARRQFNVEPLLVNRAGSLALRPEAKTAIPNMFLAADYVRTETDLACMEGANEAARRAVNAVLDATGSRHERCQIWPFSVARDALTRLSQWGRAGDAWEVGRQTATAMGKVTDTVLSFAGQALAELRAPRRD